VELSAVPDAASWGLLLAGFGLVGVVTRRRRDARSVAA
jgi:MYXO-CTERM domain-containing protein